MSIKNKKTCNLITFCYFMVPFPFKKGQIKMIQNITEIQTPIQHGTDPWWVVRFAINNINKQKSFWRVDQAWDFYRRHTR